MTTYEKLGIYEILSLLSGDLLAPEGLILETLSDYPEHKALVISCSNGKISYSELLENLKEII